MSVFEEEDGQNNLDIALLCRSWCIPRLIHQVLYFFKFELGNDRVKYPKEESENIKLTFNTFKRPIIPLERFSSRTSVRASYTEANLMVGANPRVI